MPRLVIDDAPGPMQLKNCVEAFSVPPPGVRPLFASVRCDRAAARGMLRPVSALGVWDVEEDTTDADPADPADPAKQVVARLRSGGPPSAFERRARMDLGQIAQDAEEARWAETTPVNRTAGALSLYMSDVFEGAQLRDTVASGATLTRRMSKFHPSEVRDGSVGVVLAVAPNGYDRRFETGGAPGPGTRAPRLCAGHGRNRAAARV